MSSNVVSVSQPVPVNLNSSPLSQIASTKPKEAVQIQRGLTKSRVDAFERKLGANKNKSPYESSMTPRSMESMVHSDESSRLDRSHSRVKSGIAAFESIDSKTRSPGIFSTVSMSSLAAQFHSASQPFIPQSRIPNKSSLPIISATSSKTGASSHNRLRRLQFSESVQRLKEKISFRMLVRIQQSATLEPLPPSSGGSEFGNSDDECDRDARYGKRLEMDKYESEFDYMQLEEKLKGAVDHWQYLDMQVTHKSNDGSDKEYHQLNITNSIESHGSGGSRFFSRADQEDTTLLSTKVLCNYTEPSSQANLTLSPSTLDMIQNDNLKFAFGQEALSSSLKPNRSKSWAQLYAAASDEGSHWNKPFLERYLEDCSGKAFHNDYLTKFPVYHSAPTASSSCYTSANTTRFHLPQGAPSRKDTKDSIKSMASRPSINTMDRISIPPRASIVGSGSRNDTLRKGSKSLEDVSVRKERFDSIGEISFYNRAVDVPFGSEEVECGRDSWQARYDSCVMLSGEDGVGKALRRDSGK